MSHFIFYKFQCSWLFVEVLDPFGLEFCAWWYILVYLHSSTCWYQVIPAPFVKDTFFFPFDISCFFVKIQVFEGVWIYIWVFDSVPFVFLSVLMPIPGCFQFSSSAVEFEVRDCDASRRSLIVQDCFGYPGFFCFFIWSWVLFFQGLWRILLGFWWALHWICRLLLVRLPFLLC